MAYFAYLINAYKDIKAINTLFSTTDAQSNIKITTIEGNSSLLWKAPSVAQWAYKLFYLMPRLNIQKNRYCVICKCAIYTVR